MNIQLATKPLFYTKLPTLAEMKVAVIGLGYVGLPLAIEFGKARETIGFDLNTARVGDLMSGIDMTGEVDTTSMQAAEHLVYSSDPSALTDCNVFVIAVPTPVNHHNQPDLTPLLVASETVASVIKPGDIVIYESTVYPGATEEDCIPVIERISGLTYNQDFFAGYSPERINPGDKNRPLKKIVKVTSGSTPEVSDLVDALYQTIIEAGTFQAQSIRVAEASKVIENIQRDVNIALMNELSNVFSHLEIDTTAVLDAAASKWNFNRLTPGLVGGHCIGVDPYYLIHKSMSHGFVPNIIRAARETNESMVDVAASRLIRKMTLKGARVKNGRALVLGVTFKENCPDIRNTKSIHLVDALSQAGMHVDVYDPISDPDEVYDTFGLRLLTELSDQQYDAIILSVVHAPFIAGGAHNLRKLLRKDGVLFDMKSAFPISDSDLRL